MNCISFNKIRSFCCAAAVLSAFQASFASERPVVSGISAAAGREKQIAVSWTLPGKTEPAVTSLLVFRDTQPIDSYSQLAALKPEAVLDADETGWTDTVPDYIDYYYAVIAVTGVKRYDIIIPSINSTVNGVHRLLPARKAAPDTSASAKEKLYPAGSLRETPLPYIDLIEGLNSRNTAMSKDAQEKAHMLSGSSNAAPVPLPPYIFEDDLVSPETGDGYFLFDALKTTFIKKKYAESADALVRLLGTNRSEGVTKRSLFYLGESYYFSGRYPDAVKTFLLVSGAYPDLVKKWIDSSLDFMILPPQ